MLIIFIFSATIITIISNVVIIISEGICSYCT